MPVIRRKLEVVDTMPLFPNPEQRLLRIPQCAKYLNCSVYRIRELIRNGELRIVGRFKPFVIDRKDVDAYIDKAKVAA
jgi:excisionase family DNA binding protein